MDSNLLSRKFIYALLVVILGFILVVLRMVEPEAWFNFASIIGGIYVVGNVVTDGIGMMTGNKPSVTTQTTQSTTEVKTQ